MKKLLLIVSISLIAFLADAQSFATNDAEWVFDYPGAFSNGITKVKYLKDTLIGHRNVKIFTKEAIRLSNNRDTSQYYLDPIYLHSFNGVVEFSLDKINFDTLMNFKAQIGQAWTVYRHYRNELSDSLLITVLDTFQTNISNIACFSQKIKWTYLHKRIEYTYLDTVFEHLGYRRTYIYPFDALDVTLDGGEGGEIRCFKNDKLGIVSFHNDHRSLFKYDCDQLSNVYGKMPSSFDFAIFPNPASEHVTIGFDLNKSSPIRLEVINSLGELENILIDQRYEFGQHSESISISHLSNGVYYCKLYEGDKIVGLKRFIKI